MPRGLGAPEELPSSGSPELLHALQDPTVPADRRRPADREAPPRQQRRWRVSEVIRGQRRRTPQGLRPIQMPPTKTATFLPVSAYETLGPTSPPGARKRRSPSPPPLSPARLGPLTRDAGVQAGRGLAAPAAADPSPGEGEGEAKDDGGVVPSAERGGELDDLLAQLVLDEWCERRAEERAEYSSFAVQAETRLREATAATSNLSRPNALETAVAADLARQAAQRAQTFASVAAPTSRLLLSAVYDDYDGFVREYGEDADARTIYRRLVPHFVRVRELRGELERTREELLEFTRARDLQQDLSKSRLAYQSAIGRTRKVVASFVLRAWRDHVVSKRLRLARFRRTRARIWFTSWRQTARFLKIHNEWQESVHSEHTESMNFLESMGQLTEELEETKKAAEAREAEVAERIAAADERVGVVRGALEEANRRLREAGLPVVHPPRG